MQKELLQFNLQQVWTLVDLPNGKRAIAIIEAIRLFLAYALFKDFVVYQMDVKSAFLYGKIEEEVYVCQPPGFEDPDFPDRVYKVEKALYGLHQAPRAWYETLSTYLLDNGFQRGKIDKTLFIKRDKSDILLVQVYVDDIIFGSTRKKMCTEFEKMMHKNSKMSSIEELTVSLGLDVKTARTPMETQKALLKNADGEDVDEHLYRLMIGSLMYLTSLRPDIMFTVCACARFQVNPKVSHLHAVKRIFRYLKGQPKLGLWYPKDSPFDLVAYTDSDYAGASLDRKSTTGEGCLEWNEKAAKDEIGLMLLGIYLLLLGKVNAARHKLTTAVDITFLEKPTESEGFEEIVNFLNATPIKYALTVNPTVYCSCIKQFCDIVKAKTVNREVQLQALVDKKKVIIIESEIFNWKMLKIIRSTLWFDHPAQAMVVTSDVKTAKHTMETHKPLLKDAYGEDVDEHLYRSMIGSLMYLTFARPDIMFAPWYPNDSPFDLVAYIDSDYAEASLDRKSTIGDCQFLGCRLISWQCKKQTVVANSTTEAEYIAALICCGRLVRIKIDDGNAFWNEIGVNAGDSKLMLLGIHLLLPVLVNAVRHKLTTAG
ncbi:putative ribonuclease H-like domain-containing protein [Tanacetum coccineum]|uniref:Ribonuclease H-like domain-containing protein n=1 Tax=Tanacetum coccineum TaxID=301880 RepID=A0ABQ4ZXK0_9ASTR